MIKVAVVQLCSSHEASENLTRIEDYIAKASMGGASLVVLPEMAAYIGKNAADCLEIKEDLDTGPIQNTVSNYAKKYGIWVVAGTAPIADKDNPVKVLASCIVYDEQGARVANYNKMHLFDVNTGENIYRESDYTVPGEQPVVFDSPLGRIGLLICYDLRFPELARYLVELGAEILIVPAAFTYQTGMAHWDILTRARAVENLCYLVAANQTGRHSNGRSSYGHSLICDHWGNIVCELPEGEGVITADIDLETLRAARQKFPVLDHRRMQVSL